MIGKKTPLIRFWKTQWETLISFQLLFLSFIFFCIIFCVKWFTLMNNVFFLCFYPFLFLTCLALPANLQCFPSTRAVFSETHPWHKKIVKISLNLWIWCSSCLLPIFLPLIFHFCFRCFDRSLSSYRWTSFWTMAWGHPFWSFSQMQALVPSIGFPEALRFRWRVFWRMSRLGTWK